MTSKFEPFRISVPDDVLRDLCDRITRSRLPDAVTPGWDMGVPPTYLRELLEYWANEFDWRTQEGRLNELDQLTTEIDGQRIHFIHARSGEPDALPLLLLHGWPGSVVEFLDVTAEFVDPVSHGADSSDAFHVIVPSQPGYGFSGPTHQPGWHPRRIAAAYVRLMAELGYQRYGVQGGDWGALVAQNMADLDPDHVCGLHLNFVSVPRPKSDDAPALSSAEEEAIQTMREWRMTGSGYSAIQSTRPQTVGYGLDDSPAGLCAWIIEKFRDWTDCDGDIEREFTKDQLLTNVTVYWVTQTATSAARLYYESRVAGRAAVPSGYVTVPTGIAHYPGEITRIPRSWVERRYNVTYWTELSRGGHFAAMQVPDLFVDDVRSFFRSVRETVALPLHHGLY